MTEEERITWDHSYFYLDGDRFFPKVQGSLGNSVILQVPYLADKEELDLLQEKANSIALEGKWIVWELVFPWDKKPLFIQDDSAFFSFGLWIEEFLAKFWFDFEKHTLAFILFRGVADFSSYFIWTEQQEILYQERLEEYSFLPEKESRSFFAADVFVEFLQRLCSFLPVMSAAICLVDASSIDSLSTASYLFSKERFGHLLLGLKSSKIPLSHLTWEEGESFSGFIGDESSAPSFDEATIGVCLPGFESMTVEGLSLLESILQQLFSRGLRFRMILESNLHESWDGIDDLVVISSSLSSQGLRKLRGFSVAGGRIVFVGSSFEIGEEVEFSSFLEQVAEGSYK